MRVPLSVLDLVPVREGSNASTAMRESVELARLAERLGYVRYWFAEHHSMTSIGSSAPEVLIGHIASATSRIRVGSGGVMLPNHARRRTIAPPPWPLRKNSATARAFHKWCVRYRE